LVPHLSVPEASAVLSGVPLHLYHLTGLILSPSQPEESSNIFIAKQTDLPGMKLPQQRIALEGFPKKLLIWP